MTEASSSVEIVLIDDERLPNIFYLKQLKTAGYSVLHINRASDAICTVNEYHSTIRLVLLDIMMPPDDAFDLEESNYGMETGLLLYSHIADRYPEIRIVFLTNLADPEILQRLPHSATIWTKDQLSPRDLVELVESIVGE